MKNLPRIHLAHLPTPVDELPRLSAHLGGPQMLIKRDDQTGLAFGGNKTRKLEYLLAEAQSLGARTVITGGAIQSNHCRQTAAAAARLGLDCILVLGGDRPPEPSGNLLLDLLFGAEIVWTQMSERDATLQATYETAKEAGRKPYLVPYGGSNPVGASAYAFAIEELVDQGVNPDWVVFASSSAGTQAGMVAGAHLTSFEGNILGMSVDEHEDDLKARVAGLASETAAHLGQPTTFTPDQILVNADYLGEGYGIMNAQDREAVHLFAKFEGILFDPVYTGRAAGGMIDLIRKGFFSKDETVLFWHTGGTPALLADKYRAVLEDS
ncbi:MAG: D-cysteine desulfhydrase family protein [Anaerolineales bacterium]|nr:D-cysteine desulfhydrase family protein [Chloroflexota bacterium]MBL6983739.1 D-cysteine desulfhydrase family protein [Anaerolineales bacterium]